MCTTCLFAEIAFAPTLARRRWVKLVFQRNARRKTTRFVYMYVACDNLYLP